jgi:hypothetical protein
MFNRFLTILLLVCSQIGNAQFGQPRRDTGIAAPPPPPPGGTVNISMGALGFTADSSRPNSSSWNENSGAQIVAGLPTPQIRYRRFDWADCEASLTQGDYSKLNGKFRTFLQSCINNGQMAAFGIMQFYPEVCSSGGFNDFYFYDGFCGTYPEYVHNLMQASGTSDFNDGTSWIPNYNHPSWLARWQALLVAINNWLDTETYTATSGPRVGQLVRFKDVISYVDLRGFGSYGEWHSCCIGNGYDNVATWPAGTYGTTATMKTIIDIGADSFPNYPVCIIINVLDGNRFNNTKIPVEVGIYALTKTNTFGKLGLRRDQWGDNSGYYHQILEQNTMTFNGVRADTAILNRYKYSYITGEPPGYNCNNSSEVCRNGVNMGWIPDQVQTLHAYNIGNGNWGGNAPTNQSSVDSIRRAWRLMGAQILVTGGTMTQTLQTGATFNVTLNMQNIGLAVEHRAWTTQLILKNSVGTTVWTGTHSFAVKGFLPSASSTSYSTNFTLSGAVAGTGYNLYLKAVDPLGYARDYQFWNTGQTNRVMSTSVLNEYLVRPNITVIAGP